MQTPPRATIDFESRSACSLRNCGSWRYSLDPTTEVLCLAYRLPYWPAGRTGLWHPAFASAGLPASPIDQDLIDLFDWVIAGEMVEAHNAFFERGLWTNKMQGWPRIHPEQWMCSAAKAASHALPRGLADAAAALHLTVHKDTDGEKIMKKMIKPRKPLKKELLAWNRHHSPCAACAGLGKIKIGKAKALPCAVCASNGYLGNCPPFPRVYHDTPEQLAALFAYCRQDVLAEAALSSALPDLSREELAIYHLDQRINERGFQLDTEGVAAALALIEGESVELNAELRELTGGAVEKATQRARMIDWFATEGLDLEDTTKATVDTYLDPESGYPLTPAARRGLELMQQLGKSSTAKYEKMADWACPDGRARGGLLYHGATTGRWSGAGIQPHNFVKGAVKDQEALWTLIKTRDPVRVITDAPADKTGAPIYTTVMDALSQGLRGAIVPAPGKQLFVADYASIEARVLLWLANDQTGMAIFRSGADIYCDMASSIYGREITKADATERGVGKVAILGLGYQMGAGRFKDACWDMAGIAVTEELAQTTVDAYRSKYSRVKQLWYDTEKAAMAAVQRPGQWVPNGYVSWCVIGDFLYCELPSGRRLAYPFPEIRPRTMPWGDIRDGLTFMGINPFVRQWERQTTYGGMLVENIDQAVSRDLMAAGMLRAEATGVYEIVLTVHDEIVSEAAIGAGSVKEFEALMATPPEWAVDCPVSAEGFSCTRYRK